MPKPSAAHCKKAIKLLEQFDRLARKLGIKLPKDRIEELEKLRDDGRIKSTDLPAKLRADFPGELVEMTLEEIREECGMK